MVPLETLLPVLVTTLVFVVLGLIVFALAFLVIGKATPFSVRKEIEEDHNVALAIVIASVILGSALDHRRGGSRMTAIDLPVPLKTRSAT